AVGAGGGARPVLVQRYGAGGDVRADEVPPDRRAAVSPHAYAKGGLLVSAEGGRVTDLPSVQEVPEEVLAEDVQRRRWFASKSREVASVRVSESVLLREGPPYLVLAFVEVRFHAGTHETYQLPLGIRGGEGIGEPIADLGGWTVYDALEDAELVR